MIQYIRKVSIIIFHKKPICEDNFSLKQIYFLMLIDLTAQINFTFCKNKSIIFLTIYAIIF